MREKQRDNPLLPLNSGRMNQVASTGKRPSYYTFSSPSITNHRLWRYRSVGYSDNEAIISFLK